MGMTINLKEKCGKQTISRQDGRVVADLIFNGLKEYETITIDFDNIMIASVSFLDEAFGKLAFQYSKETLKKRLAFEKIDKYDRALLNDILLSRYRQQEKDAKEDSKLN
jgi:hypothetical protein